jgi:hypothetical protein
MADVKRPRRYYLHKRLEARNCSQDDMDLIWRAKQEAEPGTLLGSDFPNKTLLEEIGYTTTEDLDGADEAELVRAGLTQQQAKTVVAAL